MSEKAMLPCLICGYEMDNVMRDCTNQPYEGTEFQSYGHYGSTFWDSFNGEQIVINVCDGCLAERKERIGRHKRYRALHIQRCFIGREWIDREMVPYFDGPEDEDEIEVELADLDDLRKRKRVELNEQMIAALIAAGLPDGVA